MRDNNFNVSDYHYDFVFGNDSIMVEAETEGHKKVLLMDKGIWKI
jgi:leucyl aminopeptidase (aminopeptidase T)